MDKQKSFKTPSSRVQLTTNNINSAETSKITSRSHLQQSSSDNSQVTDSRSDQSSVCSNKPFSLLQIQDQLDLKYHKYLRAKFMNKLLRSKMNENKDLLDRQTIQLAAINKELIESKHKLEIQNERNLISKTLSIQMKDNSKITNELLSILEKNHAKYKEILEYFTIISSQMPVNNVDLTGYNNQNFNISLENINRLLRCISQYGTKRQIHRIKYIFENIEVKNDQLCNLHKECLKILNAVASKVITNTANQLMIQNKENDYGSD